MTFPNIVWSPARMATRVLAPCVIALVLMLLPLVAYAGTITVDGTTCTLPEAITAANTDAAFDGCTAGSGPDTLLLGGLTHSLATGPYDHDGMNATPSVTSKIVISGGVGGAIVERSGAEQYRLFHIGAAGNLTLQSVTVRYGNIDGYPYRDGGSIHNFGVLTLLDSQVISNTASGGGGGINNDGEMTITNSDFISNTAEFGGGIRNHGEMAITNSDFTLNTAGEGGGIYNGGFYNDGEMAITNSDFTSNTAGIGGGTVNLGIAIFTYSDFIANTAVDGGGIANGGSLFSNTAAIGGGGIRLTFTNGEFIANTADYGGGIRNYDDMTITNSDFISNTAHYGGGIFNRYGAMILTNSDFISNTAAYGGGLYGSGYDSTAITVTNATIRANIAITSGGAIYTASGGNATIIGSRLINNHTGLTGSTIQQLDGTTAIEQSCIVNNSDTAINFGDGDPIGAANNWWGAPDGPSGAGSGGGDSVSFGVNFAPFLTTVPDHCLISVAFGKHTSAAGDLLPGQPLTYTLAITNDGTPNSTNLYVADALPAVFELLATITEGPAISSNGSSFVITDLLASQVATITLVGQVDPTLSDDTVLTNTATLTNALTGPMTATVSNNVVVPRVAWSEAAYETSAESSSFTATVTVSPTNPYISVTVQVVITDSITAVVAADVQEITFPPGSSSQPVVVTVVDGEADGPRTIQLGLQSPSGASVGDGSKANATLSVTQETQAGAIYLPKVQR